MSRTLFEELFDPIKHGVINMATKSEFLNELYKENGLVKDEDTYELSFGKRSVNIITRTGIEKIQYNHNINVTFSMHRKQSSEACDFIMDYLKKDAPFWKKEFYDEGYKWLKNIKSKN